jgi:hypothetical protein
MYVTSSCFFLKEFAMKIMTLWIALAIAAPVSLVACDRTVEEQTKTTTGENGTSTEKKVVTQQPDGTVTQTKEKSSTTANP